MSTDKLTAAVTRLSADITEAVKELKAALANNDQAGIDAATARLEGVATDLESNLAQVPPSENPPV